jgi:hypothetical protein
MNKTRIAKLFIFVLAVSALVACNKAETTISQSYRNPGFEQTVFKNILVIGVSSTEEGRAAFEKAFVKSLANVGGTAKASGDVLPKDTQLEEDELRAVVEASGFDGVLITRVLSVDKEQEYTPASTYQNPRTRYYGGGGGRGGLYGRGYYGFYGTTYATVHEPGYFETSTTLKLETNLYSVATDGLVWTGQSKTVDPSSLEEARESMTTAVAKKLKAERLIP